MYIGRDGRLGPDDKDSIKNNDNDNDNDKTIRRGFRTTPLYSYSDMAVTDSLVTGPAPSCPRSRAAWLL